MVATEHEKHEINVGDVVHIKAGERHWHGAKADTTMGHITITAVGGQAAWGIVSRAACSHSHQTVMAGLVPATHDLFPWMSGTRPGMTSGRRRLSTNAAT